VFDSNTEGVLRKKNKRANVQNDKINRKGTKERGYVNSGRDQDARTRKQTFYKQLSGGGKRKQESLPQP